MPSKRKRGNAYELRASCGFNAKGKRIMKTRTWKPPYGMTEAQAAGASYAAPWISRKLAYLIQMLGFNGTVHSAN